MATDFTMKGSVDAVSVARLAQEQSQKNAELEMQQKQGEANNILAAAKAASTMVSSSIEASKMRQRRELNKNFAESIASQIPNLTLPQQGPVMEGQPPLPPVSTPNYAAQNGVRASIMSDPGPWTKELANQMMQTPEEKSQAALNLQKTQLDVQKTQAEQQKVTLGNQTVTPESASLIKTLSEKTGQPAPALEGLTQDRANQHIDRLIKVLGADQKDVTFGEKASNFDEKQRARFNDITNYEKQARGASGQAAAAIRGISQLDALFSGYKNNLTPQEWEEASLGWARVLSSGGSMNSRAQIEALLPDTAIGSAAKAMQWFTNNPTGTKQQAFAERMKLGMEREKDINTKFLKNRTVSSLGSYVPTYMRTDPEQAKNELEQKGLTYEDVKSAYPKLAKRVWGDNPQPSAASDNDPQVHAIAQMLGLQKKK